MCQRRERKRLLWMKYAWSYGQRQNDETMDSTTNQSHMNDGENSISKAKLGETLQQDNHELKIYSPKTQTSGRMESQNSYI